MLKTSDRFNTTDTVTAVSELRWPNKFFLYDDLTLPEWAVGQLFNVFHIQDPGVARQTLLQVSLALRNTTTLPWEAIRSAWENSMHEVEHGTLSC